MTCQNKLIDVALPKEVAGQKAADKIRYVKIPAPN